MHSAATATIGTTSGANGVWAALRVLRDQRVLVISGAGLSTDSGIPDYRGPGSVPRSPMTGMEFRDSPARRRRYWSRSQLGWPVMRSAAPNAGHHALTSMQRVGAVEWLITQNVDGLLQQAGAHDVLDLHGNLDTVVCLTCQSRLSRHWMQTRLEADNPWAQPVSEIAPDGDIEVAELQDYRVPPCPSCGGVLKPDVVFFGEQVPPQRSQRARSLVEAAEALLVVGTSLATTSARSLVVRGVRRGLPVVVVNRTATRVDHLAEVVVRGGCSTVLATLCQQALL